MKNGIFGKWFREFATLVLTQTVQAFLLAIVMTIIISCLNNSSSGLPSGEANNAAGLLAIVALASFNKIERLVKDIFGVTSQFGPSLENGAKGLAGAALAYRGMQRISDNAGKMIQGSRMKKRGEAGLRALNANGGAVQSDNELLNGKTVTSTNDNNTINAGEETANAVEEQVVKLQTIGDISALTDAIKNLTRATETGNKTDTQSKMKEYQEMINKGRDMQKAGVSETIGATVGAGAGAIYGLAKGENIIKDALTGAGGGDAIGQAVSQFGIEKREYNKKMEEISKLGSENYDKSMKEIEKFQNDAAQKVVSGQVKDVRAYNQAVTDAVKQYKQNINKGMNAAVENAYKKPQSARKSSRDLKAIQSKLDRNSKADQ